MEDFSKEVVKVDESQRVLDALRDAVLSGFYAPRERLIESELTERFSASRFNIRKALAQLNNEGLVELQPNKGARVKEISVDDAIEITELRSGIESIVASKAAAKASDGDIAQLQNLALRMQDSVRNFNLVSYSDVNTEFHSVVRSIAGNSPATLMLEQLHGQIVQHQFMLALIPGRPDQVLKEHLAVIEALISRDPEGAELAMKNHINSIVTSLETFRDGQSSSIAGIREFARKAAPSVMHLSADIEPTLTVPYNDMSPNQVLDLYLPESPKSNIPVVIAIHGGAFMMGDRKWETQHVPKLNANGYAVASLEYRLSGEAIFPAAVQDVKKATAFLRKNAHLWNLDPDFFVAWGRSAGGYLAAMIGLTGKKLTEFGTAEDDSSVAAVVDWYGPSDFLVMDQQFVQGPPTGQGPEVQLHDLPNSPESKFLGAPIQDIPEVAARSNPLDYINEGDEIPPFYIAAGSNDRLVPHQQSEILAQKLKKNHNEVVFKILHDANHADQRFETELTEPVLKWLEEIRNR